MVEGQSMAQSVMFPRFHIKSLIPFSLFCKSFWLLSLRAVCMIVICFMFPFASTYTPTTDGRTHLLCIDHSQKEHLKWFLLVQKKSVHYGWGTSDHFISEADFS